MDFWRQMGIVPSDKLQKLEVTLFGCGGIGSPTALLLAKMGVGLINLIDRDKVDYHNLTSTIYRVKDVDKYKATALGEMLNTFTDAVKILPAVCDIKDLPELTGSGVVVSGLDNTTARKMLWELVKYNSRVKLYVDAGMSGQTGMIKSINPCLPDSVKWYEEKLNAMTEDTAENEEPCTARAIIYNTFMIASLICEQVKRFVSEEPVHREKIFDFVTEQYLVSKEVA